MDLCVSCYSLILKYVEQLKQESPVKKKNFLHGLIGNMSNIFFTADTHFGHSNIIKHSNRPFANIQEHDRELIRCWNEKVTQNDTVYHLGDFSYRTSMSYTANIIKQLNGNIVLIKGNHDHLAQKISDTGLFPVDKFKLVSSYYELGEFKYIDAENNSQTGPSFALCHYPMRSWNQKHRGAIHLFGHCHGTISDYCRSTDIGVDCWDYAPVPLDLVINYMKDKQNDEEY